MASKSKNRQVIEMTPKSWTALKIRLGGLSSEVYRAQAV